MITQIQSESEGKNMAEQRYIRVVLHGGAFDSDSTIEITGDEEWRQDHEESIWRLLNNNPGGLSQLWVKTKFEGGLFLEVDDDDVLVVIDPPEEFRTEDDKVKA